MRRKSLLVAALCVILLTSMPTFPAFVLDPDQGIQAAATEQVQQLPPSTIPSIQDTKLSYDRLIARSTVALALVTLVLAIFTAALWWATYRLGRDGRAVSERQAAETIRSLEIAASTTRTLQEVADATRNNTALLQPMLQKQMRAYVAVDLGQATYQDENLRFSANAVLTNTGLTPARDVSFSITAAILDLQQANTMEFPQGEARENDATLHPRQAFTVNAVVPDRYADADAAAIMRGEPRRLFVWGSVTYSDIYDEAHETQFCHSFIFFPAGDGKFGQSGFYHRRHNSST